MKTIYLSLALATALSAAASTAQAAPRTERAAYLAADAGYKAFERRAYSAAAERAREAVRLAPAQGSYWALLVNALIADQRLDEAAAVLLEAEQAAGPPAVAASREALRKALALRAGTAMYAALQAGNQAAALAAARTAVSYAPEHAGYRLTLASLLLQAGQYGEAETVSTEAIALLPDSAAALALRAHARQRLGRWPEARDDHDRALQQRTPMATQRELRLLAADGALAAGEPARAAVLLAPLAESDADAVGRKRDAARQVARPAPPGAAQAMPAPPSIDCTGVETAQSCNVVAGARPPAPGFAAATQAYRALEARDYPQALARAIEAAVAAPDNRDYQLLVMEAAQRAGEPAQALAAANAALALDGADAGLLARRGRIHEQLGNADRARADFQAALAQARAVGPGSALAQVDQAYLAVSLGDDRSAQESFALADAQAGLPVTALQDSAYASMRAGSDAQAVGYFKRAIDAAQQPSPALKLEPQLLFATRRAVADVSRTWGVLASLAYRNGGGVVPGFGVAPGSAGTKTLQAGAEVYWRPFGYRNGRYVEVFGRGFNTLYSQAGGATGSDSLQTALGIRWKPLGDHNAVLSVSRVFSRGGTPDDWLAQAAYSLDHGTDLRVDVPSWWTGRVSAEAGHYLGQSQTYGLASVQAGRSLRMESGDGKAVLFPHAVAAAEYNSSYAETLAVGAGPGVSLRYWFREDRYAAPQSYVDFTLQYRARISGDKRASGLFLTSVISY
ncbi:MAG: bacteriophage N4 adsorption protein A [Comamonadaceae bacterium]|nr:MAG: bacteriophage N4 adsorption protein A [Comamonadaceae bacterium]